MFLAHCKGYCFASLSPPVITSHFIFIYYETFRKINTFFFFFKGFPFEVEHDVLAKYKSPTVYASFGGGPRVAERALLLSLSLEVNRWEPS